MRRMRAARQVALAVALVAASTVVLAGLDGPISDLVEGFDPTRTTAAEALPALSIRRLILLPSALLAALVLAVAPGLLIALAVSPSNDFRSAVLGGFGVTALIVSLALTLLSAAGASAYSQLGYFLVCGGIALTGGIFAVLRGHVLTLTREGLSDVLIAAVFGVALVMCFGGKISLEAFNGDGFQTFYASISLIETNTTFSPPGSDELSSYPDLTTLAPKYASAWHLLALGRHEFAGRLLACLSLSLLYLACILLAEGGRQKVPGVADRALILAGLVVYFLCGAYSVTYETFADIASPFQRDTFFALSLAACLVFATPGRERASQPVLAVFFTVLACGSLPSGWGVLLLWSAIVLAMSFGHGVDKGVVAVLLASLAYFVFLNFGDQIFAAFDATPPGYELGLGGLGSRFRFLNLFDFEKFGYLLVPFGVASGIVAIASFRRADAVSRAAVLVGIAYFFMFYLQAYRSLLHHFMPAAALLFFASLRSPMLDGSSAQVVRSTLAVGLLASYVLAWPMTFETEHRLQATARAIELPDDLPVKNDLDALLAAGRALDQTLPGNGFLERHREGQAQLAPKALAYYAARNRATEDVPAIRVCTDPACLVKAAVRVHSGDVEIGAIVDPGLDLGTLPIYSAGALRTSAALRVRPEKVFRPRAAADDDRPIIDVKRFLSRGNVSN